MRPGANPPHEVFDSAGTPVGAEASVDSCARSVAHLSLDALPHVLVASSAPAAYAAKSAAEPRRVTPSWIWKGRAPGRVNLIGEHVDYMGGVVLPAAVDRYTEVTGKAADSWQITSDVEGGLRYLRAVGEELGADPQAVTVASQVPPGAGISSSAALLVAIASGLRPELDGKRAALACQRAEQKATGVQVGVMDQFASALGRKGNALLLDCSTLEYQLVPFPDEVAIAVIDSGEHRALASTPYNERRREALAGDPKRMRHVQSEIARVHSFVDALHAGDFTRMGALLKESHRSLRDDFEVSTPNVDALVERADAIDGCYGARIMGAGFGGSIIALVARDKVQRFVIAMAKPVLVCATADGAYATLGAHKAPS